MTLQSDNAASGAWRFNPRTFLAREWPYLLMLILALFGVAYTSFAKAPMTIYWIVLAPCIGVICVLTRWRDALNRERRLHLIWTQALHWGAVLLAMHLMFVADVARMMNTDSSALAALTVLALGTFTAGVHISAWRICLVGIVLGVGVPAIAWLEQSALLLLLAAVVLVAIIAPFFWRHKRESKPQPLPIGYGSDEFSNLLSLHGGSLDYAILYTANGLVAEPVVVQDKGLPKQNGSDPWMDW